MIAFDAKSSGSGGSISSLTVAHVIGSDSNRILLVGVNVYQSSPGDILTGVTFNGVAMTLIAKKQNASASAGPNCWAYLYYIVNPPTGTNNIVATASNGSHNIGLEAVSYSGAKQTGQPDAQTTDAIGDSSTSETVALTTIADNCWMVSFCACTSFTGGSFTPLAGTGTTARDIQNNTAIGDSNGVIHPAGSYSMTWNPGAGGGNGSYTVIQASIAPAAANASNGFFSLTQ